MTRDEAVALVMTHIEDVENQEVSEALDVLRGEDPEVVNWRGKYNDLKSEYVRRFTDATPPEPKPEAGTEDDTVVYSVDQMNYYGGSE